MKTYQITESELQALLKEQKQNCYDEAEIVYETLGSNNPEPVVSKRSILNAPLPDLSHLKEVEDVTSKQRGVFIDIVQTSKEGNGFEAIVKNKIEKVATIWGKTIESVEDKAVNFCSGYNCALLNLQQKVQECDTRDAK